ncbi:MAG: DNA-binding response regulator [Calditrichaeota bacterium]|nr:MAG: DNA-binding response regulator [Calditrichota bacterium]
MQKILIVEDDDDIRELVAFNLEMSGFSVIKSEKGEGVVELATVEKPDLILLDVMLPGIDGFEVCRRIKMHQELKGTPVLMLTARTEDDDIINGLETGADDYITKPFRPKILLAKVKTALRRTSVATGDSENQDVLNIHGILIDRNRYEVRLDGKEIHLSVTEFSILEYLARNPGFVYSRNQIIDSVKGDGYAVTERSVDVQILGIRKKLGDYGRYIETVRGIGYRMVSA